MRSKSFIPLPEVEKHTDAVRIDSLGLPVGFDQDRLGINVAAIEKTMGWSGMGRWIVKSVEGERRTVDGGLGEANPDGSASLVGRVVTRKASLQKTKIHEEDGHGISIVHPVANLIYGKYIYGGRSVETKVNSIEKEERIDSKKRKWPEGVMSVAGQACILDQAFRSGLRQSLGVSHFNSSNLIATGYWTALLSGATQGLGTVSYIAEGDFSAGAISGAGIVTALFYASSAFHHLGVKAGSSEDVSISDRNWSLFPGVPIDRHLMARAHLNRTLVKAIK